jgi:GAF domain-containing protein
LTECLSLSAAADDRRRAEAQGAIEQCSALATSRTQRLELLHSRLLSFVHEQDYQSGVSVGLTALDLLGQPLPARPSLPRVIASLAVLSMKLRRHSPEELAQRPGSASEQELAALRFLVALWGPSHWVSPMLNALVCVRLMDLTLRRGNSEYASMAYGCYAVICHLQGRYDVALRYGRVAASLAHQHGAYTRAIVRFLTLTFFGVFERPVRDLLHGYDVALKDAVANGEIIASHLIDGAVTTLPYLGPDLPLVGRALREYEQEARATGAKTSLELIELVRAWSALLVEGRNDPDTGARRTNVLHSPVRHDSYSGTRDLLLMQIEYLWGHDNEALSVARRVRGNVLLKGNPLHGASFALFVVLAATRQRSADRAMTKRALRFLQRLDRVRSGETPAPEAFRPSLRLARGVDALAKGKATAVQLLEEAAALAGQRGQGLLRAIALERLASAYGEQRDYARCIEQLRDAAHCYRRFGADAKAEALVREFRAIDWTQLRPAATGATGIQLESIMRSSSAIVEAASREELGPTLLRVIAAAVGAMRAVLVTFTDGKPFLVASCERDQSNVVVMPTPLDEIDPSSLALKPIRRVERSHELVILPDELAKFADDPYLNARAGSCALLCVPLLYRGDLVAVLYLEKSSTDNVFSRDDVTLVTLLGKQAAIAITNADIHRLEVEALQSKVNPHFLYNSLSVIAELVGRSPGDAEEAVYRLTRLYRYMLSSSAQQRVQLEKELGLVRDYLELEKARFGERLKVAWSVEEGIAGCQIPAMLLQPLAENAVNHGVRRNLHGGTVSISASTERDVLLLSISDDGPGWYEGRGGTGFGLKSVGRRLQLVYGNRASLRIVKQNGVTVQLRIPI